MKTAKEFRQHHRVCEDRRKEITDRGEIRKEDMEFIIEYCLNNYDSYAEAGYTEAGYTYEAIGCFFFHCRISPYVKELFRELGYIVEQHREAGHSPSVSIYATIDGD